MVNKKKLEENIQGGFISKKKHPVYNIFICNYTKKTAQEGNWNPTTLMSRGLIVDEDLNIIARPFKKFFETKHLRKNVIPNCNYAISEKLDGTLGILYWHNEEAYISTRGRFDSYQALVATEILKSKYSKVIDELDRNYTYLFEIISPKIRNIINYDNIEDLILIAIIDNANGEDIDIYNNDIFIPFRKARVFNNIDFRNPEIVNYYGEGFVLRYENGFRIKIKSDNYLRLSSELEKFKLVIFRMAIKNQILNLDDLNDLYKNHYERSAGLYSLIQFINIELIENRRVDHFPNWMVESLVKIDSNIESQPLSKERVIFTFYQNLIAQQYFSLNSYSNYSHSKLFNSDKVIF